jgi:hypothetical protein
MSRGLQWLIGICAVLVTLAIVFAVVAPWVGTRNVWGGYGRGMMGGYGQGMMGGYGSGSGGAYGSSMMGGSGMMGSAGGMMGGGMMPWGSSGAAVPGAARLTIDEARSAAETFAASAGSGLAVGEVMEFDLNFYAILVEETTGMGALEVLVDPYTGAVGLEPGPNMMWNDKYGPMGRGLRGEVELTMQDARDRAQKSLEAEFPGGRVHDEGMPFYGYFTFDFDGPDGDVAGMMSVDAYNGAVWLHTWHGDFIQEWEAES